jgi:hypothetical protein
MATVKILQNMGWDGLFHPLQPPLCHSLQLVSSLFNGQWSGKLLFQARKLLFAVRQLLFWDTLSSFKVRPSSLKVIACVTKSEGC